LFNAITTSQFDIRLLKCHIFIRKSALCNLISSMNITLNNKNPASSRVHHFHKIIFNNILISMFTTSNWSPLSGCKFVYDSLLSHTCYPHTLISPLPRLLPAHTHFSSPTTVNCTHSFLSSTPDTYTRSFLSSPTPFTLPTNFSSPTPVTCTLSFLLSHSC
jgi:hypothetical protein